MIIQLRTNKLLAFGICCAVAGMELATFLDRLESHSRAWTAFAGTLVFTAMAVSVILAARRRPDDPAAA